MGDHCLYSALSQRGLLDPIKPAYNQSRPDGQLKLTASAFKRLWISMPTVWSQYLLLCRTTVMQNSLRSLSTSCIIACYLLYFMVQGKITEAASLTVHLHITRHPIWTVGAPPLSFPPFLCQMPFLSQPSQFFYPGLGQAPNYAGLHTRWLG